MRCPTGCRARHERGSSKSRSGQYYKSGPGRDKKKALNRKRSLISKPVKRKESDTSTREGDDSLPNLLRYYGWLIQLIDGIRMGVAELKGLCEAIRAKVRQRGRESRGSPWHFPDD